MCHIDLAGDVHQPLNLLLLPRQNWWMIRVGSPIQSRSHTGRTSTGSTSVTLGDSLSGGPPWHGSPIHCVRLYAGRECRFQLFSFASRPRRCTGNPHFNRQVVHCPLPVHPRNRSRRRHWWSDRRHDTVCDDQSTIRHQLDSEKFNAPSGNLGKEWTSARHRRGAPAASTFRQELD